MKQTGGLWMLGPREWVYAISLAQLKEKPGRTLNKLLKPRGWHIPPKSAPTKKILPSKNIRLGKGPLTLQQYIPEYNHPRMRRWLNIISPSAKRLIAQKLVTTALKNLGNMVGIESEMNTSFDLLWST